MTVISGVIDRTEHTRHITISNQRSSVTGELIGIFDGRRTRPLSAIDSIMLHQTGFFQSARGNNVGAYDHMIAHFVVLPNGTILQLRDLETRLNSIAKDYGLHIEFVGCFNTDTFDCTRYRSYLADESSRRERPTRCMNSVVTRSRGDVPTLEQIRAGRQLITTLVNFPAIADQIEYILAHRQLSTISRGNCPGPHIWYNVGHWAENEPSLNLSSARRRASAIPSSWRDPRFVIPIPCGDSASEYSPRQRLAPRPEEITAFACRKQTTTGMTVV